MTGTDDLKQPWANIARKLQQVAASSDNHGIAVIKVNIVIGSDGLPITWSIPACTKLEPKGSSEKIMELLTR